MVLKWVVTNSKPRHVIRDSMAHIEDRFSARGVGLASVDVTCEWYG